MTADAVGGAAGVQRLDKWLWFTRLVKSRTQAAALIADGRVKLNRTRVEKPAQTVKAGDIVTATVNTRVRVVRVVAAGTRRGPAAEASTLYEDLTPKPAPGAVEVHAGRREPGAGRPTKRDRRRIAAFRGEP